MCLVISVAALSYTEATYVPPYSVFYSVMVAFKKAAVAIARARFNTGPRWVRVGPIGNRGLIPPLPDVNPAVELWLRHLYLNHSLNVFDSEHNGADALRYMNKWIEDSLEQNNGSLIHEAFTDVNFLENFNGWPVAKTPPYLERQRKARSISNAFPGGMGKQAAKNSKFLTKSQRKSSLSESESEPLSYLKLDDWPDVEVTVDGSHVKIRTEHAYPETVFEYENRQYRLDPFYALEKETRSCINRLSHFFSGDNRYSYVGKLQAKSCNLACRTINMDVVNSAVNIPELIGPNEKFWARPQYSKREFEFQCTPPASHFVDRLNVFDPLFMLNSSDPTAFCLVTLLSNATEDNFRPSCYTESKVLVDPFFTRDGVMSLSDCVLICMTRAECVYFTYSRNVVNPDQSLCTLASKQKLTNDTLGPEFISVTYSTICAQCKSGGWPYVRTGPNSSLPLHGKCRNQLELRSHAHCVCRMHRNDQESVTNLGILHNLVSELSQNSLVTPYDQLTAEPLDEDEQGGRFKRNYPIITPSRTFGRTVTSGRATTFRFSQVAREMGRTSTSAPLFQLWRPGRHSYSPFTTRQRFMNFVKSPKVKQFFKILGRGFEFVVAPMVFGIMVDYWVQKAKGEPQKEVALTMDPNMFKKMFEDWTEVGATRDFQLTPQPSTFENEHQVMVGPKRSVRDWVSKVTSWGKSIIDFSSARNIMSNLYEIASLVRKGSQLYRFLAAGGILENNGTVRRGNPQIVVETNGSKIEQTIIRPTNRTSELTHYSATIVPLTGTDLSADISVSAIIDDKGRLLEQVHEKPTCISNLIHNRDLDSCKSPQKEIVGISTLAVSPAHLLVRLISEEPWHVTLSCPPSNILEERVFSSISIILLHKQCMLKYLNGADFWEEKSELLNWTPLPIDALIKVVYGAEYQAPFDVSWTMTVINSVAVSITVGLVIGLLIVCRCHKGCRVSIFTGTGHRRRRLDFTEKSDIKLLKKSESSYSLPLSRTSFVKFDGPSVQEMSTFKGTDCPENDELARPLVEPSSRHRRTSSKDLSRPGSTLDLPTVVVEKAPEVKPPISVRLRSEAVTLRPMDRRVERARRPPKLIVPPNRALQPGHNDLDQTET